MAPVLSRSRENPDHEYYASGEAADSEGHTGDEINALHRIGIGLAAGA